MMVPLAVLDSSQVLGFVLFDLAVIVAAAGFFGWLARRVGQPTVVGQIIAGVVLGPTFFGVTTLVWGSSPAFLHCELALEGMAGSSTATMARCRQHGARHERTGDDGEPDNGPDHDRDDGSVGRSLRTPGRGRLSADQRPGGRRARVG